MLEANHESLSFLKDQDLNSIANYIKSIESEKPPEAAHSTTVDESTGITVYNKFCVGCHVSGAGGAPKQGDDAAWAERLAQGLDTSEHAIQGYNSMPPKGGAVIARMKKLSLQLSILPKVQGIASQSKPKAQAPATLTLTTAKPFITRKPAISVIQQVFKELQKLEI